MEFSMVPITASQEHLCVGKKNTKAICQGCTCTFHSQALGQTNKGPVMELYLSTCSKVASVAAIVAATRTATSSLAEDSQQCGDVEERGVRPEKYLSRHQSSSLLELYGCL